MQGQTVDDLSWREFYSPELFAKIRKDLGILPGISIRQRAHHSRRRRNGSEVWSGICIQTIRWMARQTIRVRLVNVSPRGGGAGLSDLRDHGHGLGCGVWISSGCFEYNGIATLDGYLGFYNQSYKDVFRTAIAPALEKEDRQARVEF